MSKLLIFFILLVIVFLILSVVCLCKVLAHEKLMSSPPKITNDIDIEDIPTFVICLERKSKERCDVNFDGIKKLFPRAKRFAAVDSKDLDINDQRIHPFARGKITIKHDFDHDDISSLGAVGCYLSHVALLKKCIELNHPIMVAEDDVKYTSKIVNEIRQIFPTIPKDADFVSFLYLNSISSFDKCKEFWCRITKPRQIRGLQLYFVTPKAAKVLLKHAFPIVAQIDAYIGYVIGGDDNLNSYAWKRNPYDFFTANSQSTIGHPFSFKRILPSQNWPYFIILIFVISLIIYVIVCSLKKCTKKRRKSKS